MNRAWRHGAFLALAVLVGAAGTAPAWAQAPEREKARKKADLSEKGSPSAQRVEGVIVKVERVARSSDPKATDNQAVKEGREQPRILRLTINTAAVWRDWVRDQASARPKSAREAAKSGSTSIATQGEPESPDTLVAVDVGPRTRLETRYRSSTDEISEGARTPEKAAAAEEATDAAAPARRREIRQRDRSEDAPRFTPDDLKPGLFVEAEYRHSDDAHLNRAVRVRIFEPVGGSQTSAIKEPPKTERKGRRD